MPHQNEVNLPPINKPRHPSQTPPETDHEAYRSQNNGATANAIALRAQDASSSLQALDQRLSQFEDRFAEAAVDRIDSVALRIEQKIAARLQQRQQARQQPQILEILDVFTIPEFDLPPAIAPTSPMGCLPM